MWDANTALQTSSAEAGRITTYVYNGRPDPFAGGEIAACAPTSATLPDGQRIAVLCRRVETATTDTNGMQGFAAQPEAGVVAREEKWTYNEFGQILSYDGPRTDIVDIKKYEYYTATSFTGMGSNQVGHTVGDLKKIIDAQGLPTEFVVYNRGGKIIQSADANGVLTTYSYDARLRVTSDSIGGQARMYEYWPTGLLRKVTQPDTSWVFHEYDQSHRLYRLSDNLGNSVTYTLDNFGNRVAEEVRDPSNQLRRQLSRSIDALGRVQQVTGKEVAQ